MLASIVTKTVPAVGKGVVSNIQTWEAIWAYAEAMDWMDKPLDFVLANWKASRRM